MLYPLSYEGGKLETERLPGRFVAPLFACYPHFGHPHCWNEHR